MEIVESIDEEISLARTCARRVRGIFRVNRLLLPRQLLTILPDISQVDGCTTRMIVTT